jgi:protein SCO1/2
VEIDPAMNRRFLPWIFAGLAAVVVVGLLVWRTAPSASSAATTGIGGPFQLVDQHGQAVNQTILKGKWSAIFFGYTYCPDVCPTTLQTLGGASDQLGPKAKAFQVVFITVDPDRDTPKQMNDYLTGAAYSRGVVGLTGSEAQIDAITKAYGVYSQKQGSGSDYSVNHSSAIYLMNPAGGFDSVIPYGLTPDQVRDHVLKSMRENAAGR